MRPLRGDRETLALLLGLNLQQRGNNMITLDYTLETTTGADGAKGFHAYTADNMGMHGVGGCALGRGNSASSAATDLFYRLSFDVNAATGIDNLHDAGFMPGAVISIDRVPMAQVLIERQRMQLVDIFGEHMTAVPAADTVTIWGADADGAQYAMDTFSAAEYLEILTEGVEYTPGELTINW